ncbi:MAG TPA: hypothetical protein ENF50_04610 [Archaeoglobus veneficus]|nr:hypothetical protein [Archaeoglobus veneficus]
MLFRAALAAMGGEWGIVIQAAWSRLTEVFQKEKGEKPIYWDSFILSERSVKASRKFFKDNFKFYSNNEQSRELH